MSSGRSGRLREHSGPILGIAAQASSSLSNLLLTVLVARSVGVNEFAAYALTLPSYVVAQRFWRVLVLTPHQISINQRLTGSGARDGAPVAPTATVAAAASLIVLPVAVIAGGPFLKWGLLLALSLPLIAVYDAVRNTALAHHRMASVAGMDFAWLTLQAIASAMVVAGNYNPLLLGFCWLLPPGLIAAAQLPKWGGSETNSPQGSKKRRLADAISDLFSSTLVAQLVPYVIAALASAPVAGAFRGAQTLTGPMNIIIMGLLPLLQNRTAQKAHDPTSVAVTTRQATLAFTLLAAVYALLISAIPYTLGKELLGDTWTVASGLLVGVALLMCLRTPFLVLATSLRSLGAVRELVTLRSLNAAGILIAASSMAAFAPANWIAPSMGVVSAVSALFAWRLLNRLRASPTEMATE